MTPPGLVIFDCDGVLVDSEPISISVLVEVITRAGGTIDEETAYQRFLGRSMATIRKILSRDFFLDFTPAHLDSLRAVLYERFRRELRPVAGVAEAVGAIAMPFCVASSSQPERIRLSLGVTGLLELFEPRIYSSTMVDRGKPAPDLFLHAAREMGAAPRDCVVIEDSPAGVEAARRAGMRVLAFTGASHAPSHAPSPAPGPGGRDFAPDLVFGDMRALPALLGRVLAGETAC